MQAEPGGGAMAEIKLNIEAELRQAVRDIDALLDYIRRCRGVDPTFEQSPLLMEISSRCGLNKKGLR